MPEEINYFIFSCLQSFFLGLIQGFTEFLPISSTAHLKVIPYLFGLRDPGVSISASLQLGSAFAILFYFRDQISVIVNSFFTSFKQRKIVKDNNIKLAIYIFVASIPIFLIGLVIKLMWPDFSDSNFRGLFFIAIISILMAILLALSEIYGQKDKLFKDIKFKDVFIIGISQSLAIFPGVSRSGITLSSALFSGIERQTAARISFLIGIPAITASGFVEFISLYNTLNLIDIFPIIFGIISSFFSSLFSINFFLKFLAKNNTFIFVYYRLFFGFFILISL